MLLPKTSKEERKRLKKIAKAAKKKAVKKAVKKSAKKKLQPPNAKYWKEKALKYFMKLFHGLPSEISGDKQGTCGHHLILKSRSLQYRVDFRNILVVAPKEHTTGNDICFHSKNALAVERAIEWMRENKPNQWEWCQEHERDSFDKSWTARERYEELISLTPKEVDIIITNIRHDNIDPEAVTYRDMLSYYDMQRRSANG